MGQRGAEFEESSTTKEKRSGLQIKLPYTLCTTYIHAYVDTYEDNNLQVFVCIGRLCIHTYIHQIKEAGPSTPVQIVGLSNVPNAGDVFTLTDNEADTRSHCFLSTKLSAMSAYIHTHL